MRQATIYDNKGRIIGRYSSNNEQSLRANLEGHHWIEGSVPSDHYIKNGQPVAMSPRPDTEHIKHKWNYDTESWEVDITTSARVIRQNRNTALEQIDRINPVWYASLSDSEKAQLATYRQALLDVPQQPGFPTTIDWPVKPSWL